LVGSYRLRSIQTKGIGRSISVGRIQVRIVVQEGIGESVDAWCAWFRHEAWFPPGIRCIGVGSEVVIKGDVFLEDNDQVLDWGGGRARGGRRERGGDTRSQGYRRCGQQRQQFPGGNRCSELFEHLFLHARDYGHTPPSQSPSFARVSMQCFVPV